ncbi:MAG: vWA domain-containing protein, partial [Planctomycetota bacterium]|nr:vWA domain-containing protein [Planctomycetota bacterium]
PDPTPPPPPPTPPTPPIDPPEDDEGPGIEAQRQPSEALPITLLLLIDRSASMHGAKLALAIEGARRAAGTLSRWDRVGVITFADQPTLDFPPRGAADALNLPLWLSTVQAGGGTDIFRALRLASQVLAKETTPIQHVILLSDGKTGGIKMWPQVVGPMGKRGVTVTAVGIGAGHSRRELRGIIQWAARGSLISVDDATELPTVMTKDTRGITSRRDTEAERLDRLNNPDRTPEPQDPTPPEPDEPEPPPPPQPDVTPPEPDKPEPAAPEAPSLVPLTLVRAHEAVRGFDASNLPEVAPPRAAETAFGAVVLLAREEEPVLAARRYGLGRVLQWALPPDDPGARAWRDLGRLFGQGARAVMSPEGAFRYLPRVVVTPTPDGDRVHVEWPKGDATRVALTWEGADGTKQALGSFDPGDPQPARMLPRTAEAALCRIGAVLEDGRPMLPVSYLSSPPSAPRDRAGDAEALAARFGAAPESGAAAASGLPTGERERRRSRVALFLWIAAFILPLDVLLHRRSMAA